MDQPVKVYGRRYLGRYWPVAFGEGFLAGIVGDFIQEYWAYPLVGLVIALYTAYRVGYLHRWAFLFGVFAGFSVPALGNGHGVPASLKPAAGYVLVSLTIAGAYHLFSGAHFFATYHRSARAWGITIAWAILTALFVSWALPFLLAALLTPVIWLCFLPLWSAHWRTLHSLLFAVVYLAVLHFSSLKDFSSWPFWAAAGGMSLIPELLARLYPERKHKLDSLPVITPTLNGWQKLWGVKEILFLLIDFYALAMEKYKWFSKMALPGKYLVPAGLMLEIGRLLFNPAGLPGVLSPCLVMIGLLFLLGVADYVMAGVGLGLTALVFGAGRGFLAGGWQPAVTGWALILFLLGAVIFFGRPAETKKDVEKWKELNKI